MKSSNKVELTDNVLRAIIVPFRVKGEIIEIGSIMETVAIKISNGNYELLYTVEVIDSGVEHYTITFVKCENPKPRTLVVDDEIIVPEKYNMNAKPAI